MVITLCVGNSGLKSHLWHKLHSHYTYTASLIIDFRPNCTALRSITIIIVKKCMLLFFYICMPFFIKLKSFITFYSEYFSKTYKIASVFYKVCKMVSKTLSCNVHVWYPKNISPVYTVQMNPGRTWVKTNPGCVYTTLFQTNPGRTQVSSVYMTN